MTTFSGEQYEINIQQKLNLVLGKAAKLSELWQTIKGRRFEVQGLSTSVMLLLLKFLQPTELQLQCLWLKLFLIDNVTVGCLHLVILHPQGLAITLAYQPSNSFAYLLCGASTFVLAICCDSVDAPCVCI